MTRDASNVVPFGMSILLHVLLLGSMLVAFDFARTAPITPLAIRATLVTEIPDVVPPTVEPDPEPAPEPVPDPEPDNSEELRRQAEEEKRRQDALIEKERLEKERLEKERLEKERLEKERLEKLRQQEEAERRQKEQEARERQEREERERRKREEEEKERRRIEAERQREEDIRRQREENERLRREAEAEARAEEIAAEEDRMAAVDAGALAVYMAQIRQKIEKNWAPPASASAELQCSVRVRQAPGGVVVGVSIVSCSDDEAVRRSVEAAIYKSSPLPEPSDPNLFDRNILLNLSIRQ